MDFTKINKLLIIFVALMKADAQLLPNLELDLEDAKRTFELLFPNLTDPAKYNIFQEKYRSVKEFNEKNYEWFIKGLNSLSIYTLEELRDKLFYSMDWERSKGSKTHVPSNTSNIPDSWDWRERGFQTPVKNQRDCGSCWSFSAAGTLEGQLYIKKGWLLSLSEQNLVDCSKSNNGCNGGLPWDALSDINDLGGINQECIYKYEAKQGSCRYDPRRSVGKSTGYVMVNPTEHDLKVAVAEVGPVAVGLNGLCLVDYKEGIFYDEKCNKTDINHAVVLVGYGANQKGQEYWIAKNSWGEEYGEKGYVRIARNKGNQCGIATCPCYATL